jgi:hypothetical protein
MAKASEEHKATERLPPEKSSEKISPNEAFHLLLTAGLQPHAARHRFEEALLTNEVRLLCNGNVVDVNFIAMAIRVAARPEPDGRWFACIEPKKAWDPGEYIFEVSRAEVEGLLGEASRPLLPGRPWVLNDVAKLIADGMSQPPVNLMAFAREIRSRMEKADGVELMTAPSIANVLRECDPWNMTKKPRKRRPTKQ